MTLGPRMHHYDPVYTDAEYIRRMADTADCIKTPEHEAHARRLRAIADILESAPTGSAQEGKS